MGKEVLFKITVQCGMVGGAPPNRSWRTSATYEVEVTTGMSVRQLVAEVEQVSRKRVGSLFYADGPGRWAPQEDDQSVLDAGLAQVRHHPHKPCSASLPDPTSLPPVIFIRAPSSASPFKAW